MNTKDLNRPMSQGVAITKSDSVNLASPTRAVYVGGTGDISAVMGGVEVIFKAVPVGTLLPISITRVNSTGTTATLLLALN